MIRYTIQTGDTVNSIAKKLRVSPVSIFAANPHLSLGYFITGSQIMIPKDLYRDTIYNILGTTNKLTEEQMKNILAGRKRIVELARNNPNEMFINGSTTQKRVALTFDDGPDSYVTPRVLDILKTNNIKANFFFIGTQIGYFPQIVKRAYNEGHLILNHSLNHPHFTEINAQNIKSQITSTDEKIRNIIGKRPVLLRPPYGETDEKVLSVTRSIGNKIVIWSTDAMDWVPKVDKQTVVGNVLNNVRPGEIILMHSGPGQNNILQAIQEIINGLKARGFSIVDLGVLLDVKPYREL